jgi:antitoxin (DNA-binding transcriptional repressor) of toxin-antitoxin stability system
MERTISKDQLQATMLEVFRELETTGDELIVTEYGRPVLKIVPIQPNLPKRSIQEIFGDVQGQVVFLEDMDAPTIDEWSEV